MSKRVEFINVSCPGPVIGMKKEIDAGTTGSVEIVVDNIPARENVIRFLKSQGKTVDEVLEDGKLITIIANFGDTNATISEIKSNIKNSGVSYIINSEVMGSGDDNLGKKLLISFINNLKECKPLPETIFFFNSGVNLCLKNSPAIISLKILVNMGVKIIACGTCTEYLGVTKNIGVGILGNLYDLTTIYQRDRVITL
jgi:selenium metabolism protein YedF